MKVIVITGVPGTGKTTIAKKLSKRLNFHYINANNIILKHKLSEGYDRKRKTRLVDIKKLNKVLLKEIKLIKKTKKYKGMVIDSHLSHYLPRKYIDVCIVTKCDIKELNKRLKNKKFHRGKILENLQAEIFDICHQEAIEGKHNVMVIDTSKISGYSESKNLKASKGFNINEIAKKVGG